MRFPVLITLTGALLMSACAHLPNLRSMGIEPGRGQHPDFIGSTHTPAQPEHPTHPSPGLGFERTQMLSGTLTSERPGAHPLRQPPQPQVHHNLFFDIPPDPDLGPIVGPSLWTHTGATGGVVHHHTAPTSGNLHLHNDPGYAHNHHHHSEPAPTHDMWIHQHHQNGHPAPTTFPHWIPNGGPHNPPHADHNRR